MKNNKKAFTLVELLVVIAILAILATVSIVGYSSFTTKAKESVALQEATQLRNIMLAEDISNQDAWDINADGSVTEKTAGNFQNSLSNYAGTSKDLPGTAAYVSGEHKVTYTVGTGESAIVITWNLVNNEVK